MEQFSFERLVAWQVALEVLTQIDAAVVAMPRPYADLANQLRRASLSVTANLAEGVGKNRQDQKRFFLIARGSACETAALVEAGAMIQVISSDRHQKLRFLLLRLVGILTGLCRS